MPTFSRTIYKPATKSKEEQAHRMYMLGAYEHENQMWDYIESLHKPYIETAKAKRTMLYPYFKKDAIYIDSFSLDYVLRFLDVPKVVSSEQVTINRKKKDRFNILKRKLKDQKWFKLFNSERNNNVVFSK